MYQTSAEYWIETGSRQRSPAAISAAAALGPARPARGAHRANPSPASGRGNAVGDLMLDRRGQQAGRRQHAGMARDQHAADAKFGASAVACIGPAPPSAHQREAARIEPAPDRDQPDAFDHLRIHHAMDAKRGLLPPSGRAGGRSTRSIARRARGRGPAARRRRRNRPDRASRARPMHRSPSPARRRAP